MIDNYIILILLLVFIYLINKKIKDTLGNPKSSHELEQAYIKIMSAMDGRFEPTIAYGTLLGYIRENNFINKDDDIDFLVNIKYKDDIIKICKDNNFTHYILSPHFLKIRFPEGDIDFYFYHFDKNGVYRQPWDPLTHNYNDNITDIILPTSKVIYKGFSVNIPHKPITYIEKRYGKNWRTPISRYK